MTLHDGAAPTASDAHASWEGLPLYAHTPWDGTVLLFYKYVHIPNPEAFCAEQIALCERLGMTGRTRIAHEGINATYAGDKAAIEQYIMHMQRDQRFADVDFKTSPGNATHFNNLQVKVHKEIICMGEVCPLLLFCSFVAKVVANYAITHTHTVHQRKNPIFRRHHPGRCALI